MDMTKYIGRAEIPGFCLKYYVLGNHKNGYFIQIIQPDAENSCQYVGRNLLKTLDLAHKLQKGAVFPQNLCEIMEDLQFEACGGN